jgi:sirohydrochlorin cobaltochelatase
MDNVLRSSLTPPFYFGQILVQNVNGAMFVLSHRDDQSLHQLQRFRDAEDAAKIARFDDAGNYRPLKTAPNLRHGWRLELATIEDLRRALNYFYPARLAAFAAWKSGHLETTPLRKTLERQSGMYRVAAKISDPQINALVADFCRSDIGCLRTILWRRDGKGAIASTKLPGEKFDPACDQATASIPPGSTSPATRADSSTVPLLCQEGCNLLVAECRKVVKGENPTL